MTDIDASRVLEVSEGRDEAAADVLWDTLSQEQKEHVEAVALSGDGRVSGHPDPDFIEPENSRPYARGTGRLLKLQRFHQSPEHRLHIVAVQQAVDRAATLPHNLVRDANYRCHEGSEFHLQQTKLLFLTTNIPATCFRNTEPSARRIDVTCCRNILDEAPTIAYRRPNSAAQIPSLKQAQWVACSGSRRC
jgi:hypothetical protein